jgi:signal transduction histidine kinase/ActR/RegA family two-component response regulator
MQPPHSEHLCSRLGEGFARIVFSFGRLIRILAPIGLLCLGMEARAMPSAPPGTVEAGAPHFVVMGPEAMGLSMAPSDMHVMPDGRILVVEQHEIAFGDGLRWDAYREADGEAPIYSMVAVDRDGRIYTGANRGISRIDLGDDGLWHLTPVTKVPNSAVSENADLAYVSALPDRWYWYGGTEAILSWMPGQTAAIVGSVGGAEHIFTLGDDVFVSTVGSGGLFRLRSNGPAAPVRAADVLVSETVTCAIPYAKGQLLVGTGSTGLKLFDGTASRPFGGPSLLNNGHRIIDLSPAGDGFFAAAVDTVGIVFFDRDGRIVQVLDRSLDHRLSRVRLLRYSSVGVLWALLDDGVARVEFPSPVSYFGPLIPSGLNFALPMRHDGKLWIFADGRAMRGVYDANRRLERFDDDTPPGRYLFTLADVDGQLFGGNEKGLYLRDADGWKLILPGIFNPRIAGLNSTNGELYYVARGEYGVIRRTESGYAARRFPMPELLDSFGAVGDSNGILWVELGSGKIGRLDPRGAEPVFRIFGIGDGLGQGWIEPYVIDGVAHFHWGRHVYRFDDSLQRFVDDREFLSRYPMLASAGGRPVTDALGRLWFSDTLKARAVDRSAAGAYPEVSLPRVGFSPTGYTIEDNGVVWMNKKGWLVRVDLRIPQPPRMPPRAMITSVQFSSTNRQLFSPGTALEPLGYADNSMVFHYAAPANPFSTPVTFETMLEGLGNHWVSAGAVGSAAFNRLKEGDYVFHVRAVTEGAPGPAASLQFTVNPPLYRSPLAWIAYFVGVLGLFAFVIWLTSFLEHRENARLERLITERTKELNATNAQLGRQITETTVKSAALAVSEERYRTLNAELEKRVAERTAQLEATLEKLAQARKMEAVGQLAGGVAHDYNNILTATLMQIGLLSISPDITPEMKSGIGQLELMAKRAANLTRRLLTFSRQQVVQMKVIDIEDVIDNLLKMLRSLLPENVELIRHRGGEPLWIEGDVGLVEQVVTNLCVNARDAMMPNGGRLTIGTARVTLGEGQASPNLEAKSGKFIRLTVADNGCGMDAGTLQHIFEPFFTTKEMGTGLGLATVFGIAKQHRGWVEVQSDLGRGSSFQVYLPEAHREAPPAPQPPAPGIQKAHECILAVEDEDAVRTMAVRMLKRIGYRVLEAVDGEDAIRVWNEHKEGIDLLFSDMVMPKGLSGLDLANRFKAERPGLRVVITSGYSVNLTTESILNGPGYAFLAKPYQVDGLATALRKSLDGVNS